MILTNEQKRMYGCEYRPRIQKAIRLLVEYGEASDAERMANVDSTHIIAAQAVGVSRVVSIHGKRPPRAI